MIGFLFKKFFYDLWDNLFFFVVLNFGFIIFASFSFFLLVHISPALMVLLILLVYFLCVWLCSAASTYRAISDYHRPDLLELLRNIKNALLPALVFFGISAFVIFIMWVTIPFYLKMENAAGLAAAVFSCFICLFIICSIQFYPAVYFRLGMRPIKCLKKCAIIFFDNTGFCFFVLFFNVIFTVLILPFPSFNLLFADEALRLRLLKYDWMGEQEAKQNGGNYQQRQKKIPWNELLAEEKEKTGHKTLKSFIFPWKE